MTQSPSLGYLSTQNPSFECSLSILDQYKLEYDYLPNIKQSLLEQFSWDEKFIYRVLFIINELSINAFEYGCQGDIHREVDISVGIQNTGRASERVIIEVQSPGDGFDISKHIEEESNRQVDDIGGLGLITSERLSDIFTYSKDGKVIQSIVLRHGNEGLCRARGLANVILVQVTGRIDHTTAKAFENEFLPLLNGCSGEDRKVLLDLNGVPYMSSAGLRVLILAAKQCQKQNGEIVIADLQPLLQEVFRTGRLETVFRVFKTVREALEAISPAAALAYDRLS